VIVGAGDDCAVLDVGLPDRWLLFKTDAVVEGVHFDPTARPEQIGHKALARCLSDIAAMAGEPSAALITLALPAGFEVARIERVYAGLNDLARRHEVAIVGGETTTNPERLLLSVALLGSVAKGRALLRRGAQPEDALFVTGELGGSLAGKHLEFEPRLVEARWLAGAFPVHAMIDLSDGLAGDLRHLLAASQVGAELQADAVPVSLAARRRAREHPSARPPLAAALADGEDFELLFTLPKTHAVPLLDAWKTRFPGLRLTCIGRITAEPGLRLHDRGGVRTLDLHGYAHFAQS
jgi:thiamine-monophosphate kinase